MKSIKQWQKEVHENAIKHGFWENERHTLVLLCLVHSEVSEAVEGYRNREDELFKEELADVVIRVMDICEKFDIDLEKEILRKHEINKKRSYRHGGKRA